LVSTHFANPMLPGASHPKLNYTPDERRFFGQLFAQCDTDNTGVITGETAVNLLQRTRLPEQKLGEVSDEKNAT
jgi:epidermal growth factor receptor substrate 15